MLEHKLSILVLLLALVGCKNEQPVKIKHHYQLKEAKIETSYEKTSYHLPDLINLHVSIEMPETYDTKLSINKSYKDHFELENFHQGTAIGSMPNRIITKYRYTFSALEPGTFYIPEISIKATENNNEFKVKTDSIKVAISGIMDFTAANDSINILPIQKSIPVSNPATKWWFLFLVFVAVAYFRIKNKYLTKSKTDHYVKGLDDYVNELKALVKEDLSPSEFDTQVNRLFHLILQCNRSPLREIEHQRENWKSFFTKQSFAVNCKESERQAKLVDYIIKNCGKQIK